MTGLSILNPFVDVLILPYIALAEVLLLGTLLGFGCIGGLWKKNWHRPFLIASALLASLMLFVLAMVAVGDLDNQKFRIFFNNPVFWVFFFIHAGVAAMSFTFLFRTARK